MIPVDLQEPCGEEDIDEHHEHDGDDALDDVYHNEVYLQEPGGEEDVDEHHEHDGDDPRDDHHQRAQQVAQAVVQRHNERHPQ
eukprot:5689581-Pyramimonas_sp.AAC.1